MSSVGLFVSQNRKLQSRCGECLDGDLRIVSLLFADDMVLLVSFSEHWDRLQLSVRQRLPV